MGLTDNKGSAPGGAQANGGFYAVLPAASGPERDAMQRVVAKRRAALRQAFSEVEIDLLVARAAVNLSDTMLAGPGETDYLELQDRATWPQGIEATTLPMLRDIQASVRRDRSRIVPLIDLVATVRAKLSVAPVATDAIEACDALVGWMPGVPQELAVRRFGAAATLLDYLDFVLRDGCERHWDELQALAEQLHDYPVMARKADVVGTVEEALGDLFRAQTPPADGDFQAVASEMILNLEGLDPLFSGLDEARVVEFLRRADPVNRHLAWHAPYFAAALALDVRAFGAEVLGAESEETARRALSNGFRNARNATAARRPSSK